MSTSKPSFRFSDDDLAAARAAAVRDGVHLSEFVRCAVAERVAATNAPTDAAQVRRLGDIAERIEAEHAQNARDMREALLTLSKAGRALREIEQSITAARGGVRTAS